METLETTTLSTEHQTALTSAAQYRNALIAATREIMVKDQWVPIVGYESSYLINKKGEILSVERKRMGKDKIGNDREFTIPEKVKQPYISKTGYWVTSLWMGNKLKLVKVHRLIAEAFIPNPHNFPIINHINGIKTDNRIENLEWCTQKHNVNHALETKLMRSEKEVHQYDSNKNYIRTHKSQSEAARFIGLRGGATITKCIKNPFVKKTLGYYFTN